MCKWGTDKFIFVIRRNHPDSKDGWHRIVVDACIADYVQKMNDRGIITRGCCCGHGKEPGSVLVDRESIALMDDYGYAYEPYENGALIHYINQ